MKFGTANFGRNMRQRFYHEPVLVREVLEGLKVTAGKRYIDATLGGGGHAEAITRLGGIVLGIDTDREAIEENKGKEWKAVFGNFRDIERIVKEQDFGVVDGILFDLGVSSHQLDTAGRGFSYRFASAPLDLRFNQGTGVTAAQLVNRWSEKELYEIIAKYGEEERARAISSAIVRARAVKPIQTVKDLTDILGGQQAVLSRVFQALRITINDELEALKEGLSGAAQLLVAGGRVAVISFHSLEDRIVKRTLVTSVWQPVTKKPIIAGEQELRANKRSRSAKLRIAQKI